MKTRATFEEALRDAEKYIGLNPRILALPKTFNGPDCFGQVHVSE